MEYIIALGLGIGLHYLPMPVRKIIGPIMLFISGGIS